MHFNPEDDNVMFVFVMFPQTFEVLQHSTDWQSAATCSSWILARGFSTLNMEAICSSETSVHKESTRRHIQEDEIFQISFLTLKTFFFS
jgi:hypothetical protein